MSKFPISWHEDCLKNFKASLEKAKIDMDKAIAFYDRMNKEYDFRLAQIEEARRRGMDSFDNEKLLIKKKTK